jgi:hypothetical protein
MIKLFKQITYIQVIYQIVYELFNTPSVFVGFEICPTKTAQMNRVGPIYHALEAWGTKERIGMRLNFIGALK